MPWPGLWQLPAHPGYLCSPWVSQGSPLAAGLAQHCSLALEEPEPSPAQQSRRGDPSFVSVLGDSPLFWAQPLILELSPLLWGSAPCSGAQLLALGGPCSAVQQQQGSGWAEGCHPGPCCTGGAFPEPWKPHVRSMDLLLPGRMEAWTSKAVLTGSILAARGCSELLHPHNPQNSSSPLLRGFGDSED